MSVLDPQRAGRLRDVHVGIIATMEVAGHRMFHLCGDRDAVRLVYPYCVLRYEHTCVLVDTGFDAEKARRRGFTMLSDPEAPLRALGLGYGDVDAVVVSHLHFDHFCDPERFANARFLVQRADVEYFTGRGRHHPVAAIADAESLAALPGLRAEGRLVELDGDAELLPGLGAVAVGGHTPGTQVVVIGTGTGNVVLACDASHFYENLASRTPTAILHSYDDYQRGFDTIATLAGSAGRWFPGHDPSMVGDLVPVADGLYRLSEAGSTSAVG